MSCNVFTARISTTDPDRLDITTESKSAHGRFFAPSQSILRPALAWRREAAELRDQGRNVQADHLERALWTRYAPAYRREMLEKHRRERALFEQLIGRRRVVLTCFCVLPPEHVARWAPEGPLEAMPHCHLFLLAAFLGRLGASLCGEVPEAAPLQVKLPGFDR